MCPIQKSLRPRFSASPNKAPFQRRFQESRLLSSSQERPLWASAHNKARCVWAPRLCQAWNLILYSLAALRVQCFLPSPWKAWGEAETERQRCQISSCGRTGTGLLDNPHDSCPVVTTSIVSDSDGDNITKHPDHLASSQGCWCNCSFLDLSPFPPSPQPLLSRSVSLQPKRFSSVPVIPSPSFHPSNLFLSTPCLLAFLGVPFRSVSFDTGPRPAAKFQTH